MWNFGNNPYYMDDYFLCSPQIVGENIFEIQPTMEKHFLQNHPHIVQITPYFHPYMRAIFILHRERNIST